MLWGRGVDPVFFGPEWELSDFHGSRRKPGQAPALPQLIKSADRLRRPRHGKGLPTHGPHAGAHLHPAISATPRDWQEQPTLKGPGKRDKDAAQEGVE